MNTTGELPMAEEKPNKPSDELARLKAENARLWEQLRLESDARIRLERELKTLRSRLTKIEQDSTPAAIRDALQWYTADAVTRFLPPDPGFQRPPTVEQPSEDGEDDDDDDVNDDAGGDETVIPAPTAVPANEGVSGGVETTGTTAEASSAGPATSTQTARRNRGKPPTA